MRRAAFYIFLFAVALSGAAAAQPAAPTGALFMAPMGEPFRASTTQTGAQVWFAQVDADHDGKISLAEFIAEADTFFTRVDSSGDGVVTSLESTTLWQRQAPEVINPAVSDETPLRAGADNPVQHQDDNLSGDVITPGHARHRTSTAQRPVGAQAYGLLGDIEPVMSCDADFDRRITKPEFERCAARRFAQLDANHDGSFTPDEIHPWLTTDQARAEH